MSAWKLNNMVIHFNLNERCNFDNMPCNHNFSYEPELFPAALISKWNPIHITLFPNGKGMITGVRYFEEALQVINEIPAFLLSKCM